jgi:hypothetical protein
MGGFNNRSGGVHDDVLRQVCLDEISEGKDENDQQYP